MTFTGISREMLNDDALYDQWVYHIDAQLEHQTAVIDATTCMRPWNSAAADFICGDKFDNVYPYKEPFTSHVVAYHIDRHSYHSATIKLLLLAVKARLP